MNKTDLQKDFYKRFPVSRNRLVFSKAGLLCTLLGHSEIPGSEFISCTLSMCVKIAAHKIEHNTIKLENTHSSVCTIFRTDDLFNSANGINTPVTVTEKICGAELLYDDTIPQCFSNHSALYSAVLNTLLKISGIEYSDTKKAVICAKNGNIAPYSAIFSAKKGWCNVTSDNHTSNLPLPLTGYKLVAIQTKSQQTFSVQTFYKLLAKLHNIYPHITRITDINADIINDAKTHLTPYEYCYLQHIISENKRIKNAKSILKACRIKEFAQIISSSQYSIESFLNPCKEHTYLCRLIESTGCSLFARQWKNGIIAAVDEDMVDYVINYSEASFSSKYGYKPVFCISDTDGTE